MPFTPENSAHLRDRGTRVAANTEETTWCPICFPEPFRWNGKPERIFAKERARRHSDSLPQPRKTTIAGGGVGGFSKTSGRYVLGSVFRARRAHVDGTGRFRRRRRYRRMV